MHRGSGSKQHARRSHASAIATFGGVDFTAIVPGMDQQFLPVVHPSLRVSDVTNFIKLARARPGEINFASAVISSGSAGW